MSQLRIFAASFGFHSAGIILPVGLLKGFRLSMNEIRIAIQHVIAVGSYSVTGSTGEETDSLIVYGRHHSTTIPRVR